MSKLNRAYGWKRGLPDLRDHKLTFGVVEVPASVDLRTSGSLPDIWDQGQIGSCTAHGSLAAYSYDLAKQGGDKNFDPSRLFQYYNSRLLEGTVSSDSGATVSDAIKSMNKYGAPVETDWPYDTTKFATKPPQKAYDDGKLREAVKYAQVSQTVSEMQACLATGTPFVIGFTVYDSFESDAVASTGVMPMPSGNEQVLGGHCVLVVGYETKNGKPVWICRNSWGTGWGDKGYFYMPQAYLTNTDLSDDFWVVQSVSSPTPAPTPTPPAPPQDPDSALWTVIGPWTTKHHIGETKTVSSACRLWAHAKGLV